MIGAQHCQATPRTLFPPWWGYRAGTCAVPNPTKFFARSAGRGSLRHPPPPRWLVGVWTPWMDSVSDGEWAGLPGPGAWVLHTPLIAYRHSALAVLAARPVSGVRRPAR